MGVPKFFRWLSERYPCLSQQVSPFQIPDFDNLYLDMNGLIHPCSHPNDGDAHFRISEKEIFSNIFQYIEKLFRMIKPRKVFFMAVDGVAPRAKMNQQRGRRFRTARDMLKLEDEARKRGESLPSEKRFDSNCITPGTGFMCRLHEQLKFFVAEKISTDPLWQRVRVILSGHDVPGEGEHKIMEFIRHERTLPDYCVDTRHCMYGLDADLIVLGLCTHEPYFSLLREEVKFTKSKSKRPVSAENVNFFLLHLSMLRDYIDHEFSQLRLSLKFDYDLERIIDDWVLMGFLVGNDFIPHLPNMHINTNALALIYTIYKNVLPSMDGYINSCGTLNLERFELLLKEIALWELERVQDDAADIRWLEGKRKKAAVVSKPVEAMKDLEMFFNADDAAEAIECISLEPAEKSPFGVIECDIEAELRSSSSESDASLSTLEYRQVRRYYYSTKLRIDVNDASALEMAVEYVRAIQWILHYYYNGVCSWSWFYPYHYAPMVGDLQHFCHVHGIVEFELGTPFLPYEQLMGVLPPASADCLPECLQPLMLSKSSPLSEFFPESFETDLNGKVQEWEAIVLLPFIDEIQLLEAMTPLYAKLSDIESTRNQHGNAHEFRYTSENQGVLAAPDHFPDVAENFCSSCQLSRDHYIVERAEVRHGLLPGVRLNAVQNGFPTLKNVQHSARLEAKGVRVFEQSSRGLNMMLYLDNSEIGTDLDSIARTLVQRERVFAQWPFLIQIKVESVTDGKIWLTRSAKSSDGIAKCPISEDFKSAFTMHRGDIIKQYLYHRGIELGDIDVLVYGRRLVGCRIVRDENTRKLIVEKTWSPVKVAFALQTCVWNAECEDECDADVRCPLAEESLKPDTICFMLTARHYGQQAKMVRMMDSGMAEVIPLKNSEIQLPAFSSARKRADQLSNQYMPGYIIAKKLGVSSHLVSMLTSCVLLVRKRPSSTAVAASAGSCKQQVALAELSAEPDQTINIAVDCKHSKKCEQVAGWSWYRDGCWLYSSRVLDTLTQYKRQFPEVFTYMSTHEGFKIKDTDLWPVSEEVRSERYKSLSVWVQSVDCGREERWLHGSSFLDPDVVACVEAAVDESCADTTSTARAKSVMAPLDKLFTADLVYGNVAPDSSATYQLFDRVVNVRPGNGAPYAAAATITGIRPGVDDLPCLCDLVFDRSFSGGRPLRCSESRGFQLPTTALINISHARRLQCFSARASSDRPQHQQHQQHQQRASQHLEQNYRHHNQQQQQQKPDSRQHQRHQHYQQQNRRPVVDTLVGIRPGDIGHQITPRFPVPYPHVRPMTQSSCPPPSMFGPIISPGPDIMSKLHRQLSGPRGYSCRDQPPSGSSANYPPALISQPPPPCPTGPRSVVPAFDGTALLARSSQLMSKKSTVSSVQSSSATRHTSKGGAGGDVASANITGSVLRLLSSGDNSCPAQDTTSNQASPQQGDGRSGTSNRVPPQQGVSQSGSAKTQTNARQGKQRSAEVAPGDGGSSGNRASSGGQAHKSRVFRSSRPNRNRLVASFGPVQNNNNMMTSRFQHPEGERNHLQTQQRQQEHRNHNPRHQDRRNQDQRQNREPTEQQPKQQK